MARSQTSGTRRGAGDAGEGGPRLSRTTWATLVVMGLLVALYLAVLSGAQIYYRPGAPVMSTYNTDQDGMAALYRYLGASGVATQRLEQYDHLPEPVGTTIVVAGPLVRRPTPARVAMLADWVKAGGRLVLATAQSSPFDDVSGLRPVGIGPVENRVTLPPAQPTRLTQGVRVVQLDEGREIGNVPADAVVHLGTEDSPRLASRPLGKGSVVLLADEWALSNAGLPLDDDLALALAVVLSDGTRRVVFDEYHHGYASGGGAWDRLAESTRVSLIQAALAAGLLVVARGRRMGKPVPGAARSQRPPVDYVESLAGLLARARAAGPAAETLARSFERELVARYGAGASDPRTARAILTQRGLGAAAAAVDAGRRKVEGDRGLVSLAVALARGRREVSGANRGRSRAR